MRALVEADTGLDIRKVVANRPEASGLFGITPIRSSRQSGSISRSSSR